MKQIHIKLPDSLHRELKIQAVVKGQTLQSYVVNALEEKVERERSAELLMTGKGPVHYAESE